MVVAIVVIVVIVIVSDTCLVIVAAIPLGCWHVGGRQVQHQKSSLLDAYIRERGI